MLASDSQSKSLDAVGTGSMVVDEISYVPTLLGADGKIVVHQSAERPAAQRLVGGVCINHLSWASLLGLSVGIFGKQGDDEPGAFLRAGLDRLGIEQSLDLSGSSSSFSRVYVDDRGQRAIYMARGATAELTPGEIESRHLGLLRRARIVTGEVSQVPLISVLRSFELAHEFGARTVLDLDVAIDGAIPVLGSEADLQRVLHATDILKASANSLVGLAQPGEPEKQVLQMADAFGCEAVILTLGERGALIQNDGQTQTIAGFAAEVVDPTGAGDAFLGGVLCGMARDLDWSDSLRLGNACGAACCEQVGGVPLDPDRARERIRALVPGLADAIA